MTLGGRVVNARFRDRPITGVERYGRELLCRIGDDVRLVAPTNWTRGLRGHVWEQLWLPRLVSASELLWSPANSGPLGVATQVVTIHDLSVLEHPEWFDRGFARWYGYLLPRLARRVRRIITVSEFSRSRIIDRLGVHADRVVSIPNGVAASFQVCPPARVAEVRDRYRLPPSYCLVVGSLEPRKNLQALFRAWDRLPPRYHDVELAVVGAPNPSFRGQGFDRLPRGARAIGTVQDDDLPAVYTGAIAFVMPSLYEGFGLTVLEAMACGVPVLASRGSALPEVVGDAGLLVDPLDAESIAEGLQQMLDDAALRETLRERGLDRARQFSWDRAAALTAQVLRDAAA